MFVIPTTEKREAFIKKFIDWDKIENDFYNNFYLNNCKVVVKTPLIPKRGSRNKIKIKKFNLEKYTFLISYD
ncbi:hypothetical protein LCGC14_1839750 [marine sediment metagenome]|uniref:Uncharacterized protein n=1 Tax=marine sediment metagenome TaxID=412755 RepID=A0A0F9H1S4_9ZZZZ